MKEKKILVRERPFNSDSQCCWKKYSNFGGGETNNLIQSFCHNLMLNSGKKNLRFARQKNYILTLVLSKKIISERNKKT